MTKTISLSKRLRAIADMVSFGNRLADIGTDHGYLPIWLLQNEQIPYAIGMDVRPGPLEHARQNMKNAGISDRMELRLSDGLEALKETEADSIVISGMGGMLIQSIIKRGYQKAVCAKELILSPQSDIPILRQYLRRNGFLIIDEDVVMDAGKNYTILKAIPASNPGAEEDSLTYEDRYGPILLSKRPDAYLKMLALKEATNLEIIHQLKHAPDTDLNRTRLQDLYQQQNEIRNIIRNENKEEAE